MGPQAMSLYTIEWFLTGCPYCNYTTEISCTVIVIFGANEVIAYQIL